MERFIKGFGKFRDINFRQGYGFVEIEGAKDADEAVYKMINQSLCGRIITDVHFKGIFRSRNFYNNR